MRYAGLARRDFLRLTAGGATLLATGAGCSVYNPKTDKYFGFSHFWTPNPTQYRTDLWGALGSRPGTWEDVLVTGRRLKTQGHPIGIGMSADQESSVTLLGLMHSFGAIDEVVRAAIVPQMFADAARGEMSAEEAAKAAEAKIKPIYGKWRERGRI